jgi:hypothetical protein
MGLKLKIRTMFPALVTAASPLTLVKTGLAYAFSLNVTALRASLDVLYAPASIMNYVIVTAAGTYAVQAADNIILINKTVAAANSVQLPLAAARNGLPVTVKDLKGDAATNNITVLPAGAETIDGLASVPINANYGGYKFWPLSTGGWLILP